jgi:ribonuclease HI
MQTPVLVDYSKNWIMYFDGSRNLNGSRAGIYFISSLGDKLRYILCLHFRASNNTIEYEVALHGLRIAIEVSVKHL